MDIAREQQNKYTIPAIYAILLWEALINLDEEYELIHRTRWCHVKVCYLLCRYYPLAIAPLYIWVWGSDAQLDPRVCARLVLPLQVLLVPLTALPQCKDTLYITKLLY
ncbi:hypothetical protein HGRIS_004882 [Hohenbuehelia grisea]|uniref:DUF6533 domain-containing protein n=1 Tax=Hohenbuehelia grisea TaxID=104357 RepID=A0ABR3JD99_9AGAR